MKDERESVDENGLITMTLESGRLRLVSRLQDYANRGDSLESFSLLRFVHDTYNGTKLKPSAIDGSGSRSSERCFYLDSTDDTSKCRVVRRAGHQTIVEFVGGYLPRNDSDETRELYCATMLALLVPWRDISKIHGDSPSLEHRFGCFVASADPKTLKFLKDVQYYFESSDGSRRRSDVIRNPDENELRSDMVEEDSGYDGREGYSHGEPSEEDIRLVLERPYGRDEECFAQAAMNIAMDSGIFSEQDDFQMNIDWKEIAPLARLEDWECHRRWERIIERAAKRDNDGSIVDNSVEIIPGEHSLLAPDLPTVIEKRDDARSPYIGPDVLNQKQRMVHEIVSNHLNAELDLRRPPQLLILVIGHGGTGKSTLLNAITASFEEKGVLDLLAKTAMTGVAASVIGGTTLHWWAGLPPRKMPKGDEWMNRSSKAIKKRRQSNIESKLWLSIDEAGMLTKDELTFISQIAGTVRTGNGNADSTIPFGGLNVLLIADFHQFPPTANPNVALYSSDVPRQSSVVGENIYKQFDTVIELTEQKRVVDSRWEEILHHSRTGDCTEEDLAIIHRLVLTDESCDIPDFTKPPWSEVILVTPRNSVRAAWNTSKMQEHCRRSGNLLYRVKAEDTAGKERRTLSLSERLSVAGMNMKETCRMEHMVEIAIGTKSMVTQNIATDLGLANGSRGIIVDIVLDPRERINRQEEDNSGIIELTFPPTTVILKLSRKPTFDAFPGLRPGEVPIFPFEGKFHVGSKAEGVTITRRQTPLTPAYAFTDQKSQAQTLGNVIVDIGFLKRFPVNQFAAYVALSRSTGHESIRLLRDFDKKLFTTHPSQDLKDEDERLQTLIAETRERWDCNVFKY